MKPTMIDTSVLKVTSLSPRSMSKFAAYPNRYTVGKNKAI